MIERLLQKLPIGRRIVALVTRHFTLLESLAQQLSDIADGQRMALEDRTQQLEASAQLIEIGRANSAALLRIEETVLRLLKDLQEAMQQLEALDHPQVPQDMVDASAPALGHIERGILQTTEDPT